jgi:hypothetical protein
LEHRYPLITLACLQSVCDLVCDFFPTNQSFDDGSLSFEHIHFGCWLWELHHIYRIVIVIIMFLNFYLQIFELDLKFVVV